MKQKQLDEIKLLENEISQVRQNQSKLINDLRSDFFIEKTEHKRTTDQRIAKIVKVANREAKECLAKNTFMIKNENQTLRNTLFGLLDQTKILTENKERLEREKVNLLHEIKYAEDLKKVRSTQQKRVIEKLFPNNDYLDDY